MRVLFLIVFALFLCVPGISQMPPIDRDEPRYLQATKQMVESGDYVDIRFQDEARYKKPIGIYWLQSAALTLSGMGDAAPVWVYRLVSTLAFVIAILALYFTGSALFGPTGGLVASVVLAGMFGVAFEGRIAKTDAMLLAFTIIAQGALARIHLGSRREEARPSVLPWVFWIAQGCGILIKGPIPLLASGLTIVAVSLYQRDWRWLSRLRPLPGIALLTLIVLPWLALISWRSGGAFLEQSLGHDLLGKVATAQESHGAPPGFYALTYSLYVWPFGPLAIGAGLAALNRLRSHPSLAFCLAWYVPFWLVFEAFPTKLIHYALPAYPALALLVGWAATLSAEELGPSLRTWQRWLFRLTGFGLVVVTIAMVGIVTVLPFVMTGEFPWVGPPIAVAVCLAAWLAFPKITGLQVKGSRLLGVEPARIVAASAAAGVVYSLFFTQIAPSLTPIWLSPRVTEAFLAHKPCETSVLASVGYHEPSLIFAAGRATRFVGLQGAAEHLAADPACAIALVPRDRLSALRAMMPPGVAPVSVLQDIGGFNFSTGRILDMLLVRPVAETTP